MNTADDAVILGMSDLVNYSNVDSAFNKNKLSEYESELANLSAKVTNEDIEAKFLTDLQQINDKIGMDIMDGNHNKEAEVEEPIVLQTDEHIEREEAKKMVCSVVNDPKTQEFNLDDERQEDDKMRKLGDIDEWKTALRTDGEDITTIPDVNIDSSYDSICAVWRYTKRKYDRHNSSQMFESIITTLAIGMENLFDGNKTYFGNYRPNLRGWNNTVHAKLRRQRGNTYEIMEAFMPSSSSSTLFRLLFELIPSAFLHSYRMNSAENSNLHESQNYGQLLRNIRDFDKKKD